jgi:hypothetical protein
MKCFDPRSARPSGRRTRRCTRARWPRTAWAAGCHVAIDDACSDRRGERSATSSATYYVVGRRSHVRPLYTGAYVYTCDKKPMDGLTDLCQAMGGIWVWSEGQLRLLPGTYRTPNPGVLDETWLTDDQPADVQAGYQRMNKVNTITSSIADQFQDYTVVPAPKISPDTYVTADGGKLAQDIEYAAVPFAGQAQYLSSCLLRRQRQGLVVKLQLQLPRVGRPRRATCCS